jgi:hypothetical protein
VESDFHFSDLLTLLNSEIQIAKKEVFIAAPYIKVGVVKKLDFPLALASETTVVCRWKLDDVLSGATDIGIYPILRDNGIKILLHPSLHAKYYRSDNRILMGSANLTSNGLINEETGSLEALTKLLVSPSTIDFEKRLIQESIEIDDELYSEYLGVLNLNCAPENFSEIDYYWPKFASFEEAWSIYNQADPSSILKPLGLPPTLEKSKLKSFIKIRLKEFSNIHRIEKFLESGLDGRRFGEVRALIREMDELVDETSAWQNLMSLLLDLFPERYEYFRPNHTEIILSKKKI